MKKINIGLIGFGNIGSGVVKILREKRTLLSAKIGLDINIRKICDQDITSKRNVSVNKMLLTRNPKDIIEDPQIDIMVELIGGIHPARELILDSIKRGKNIVTANKALLATYGEELFLEAGAKGKSIYFEASVGAGIPIIKSLREGLVSNNFNSILGILNGTSNYILSSMSTKGITFSEALKEAQRKGFAEKDPTLDVQGIDSAHKLALLTYLSFGKMVNMRDIFIEGISRISLADINYAKELGFKIKLLAIAQREKEDLEVRVHPTLIPKDHLLSSIDGVFNAIYVEADLAGDLLFYGPGAGQLSAASAVVSDIVDLTKDIKAGLFRPMMNAVQDKSIKRLRKIDESLSRYYIRFTALDKPGVLAKISGVLAKFGISISSVTQKEKNKSKLVPIIMLIHEAKEKDLRRALNIIDRIESIKREVCSNKDGRDMIGVINRYKKYLPVTGKTPVITLNEGNTPLLFSPSLSSFLGEGFEVYLKVEGLNPTGSFKDRGMTLAISKAKEEGSRAVICASTGNTSASAAAYAARAKIKCVVLIPKGAIALGKLSQALIHGAVVLAVEGNFDEALTLVREASDKNSLTLVNSLNPYRIEGQKTASFEICDFLGDAPDFQIMPVGNAGNITAYWKGYKEYHGLKLSKTLPKMLGFQAEGSAPIVRGYPIEKPETIATAIRIGNPASWKQAERARDESGGLIDMVSDKEIIDAYKFIAKTDGVFIEPASASSIAGLFKLSKQGYFKDAIKNTGKKINRIVCILTGHGLKDPDTTIKNIADPKVIKPELNALLDEIKE